MTFKWLSGARKNEPRSRPVGGGGGEALRRHVDVKCTCNEKNIKREAIGCKQRYNKKTCWREDVLFGFILVMGIIDSSIMLPTDAYASLLTL